MAINFSPFGLPSKLHRTTLATWIITQSQQDISSCVGTSDASVSHKITNPLHYNTSMVDQHFMCQSGSNQGLHIKRLCVQSMTYIDVSTWVEFFPELLQVNFYHLQTAIEHNVHVLCVGLMLVHVCYTYGSTYNRNGPNVPYMQYKMFTLIKLQ